MKYLIVAISLALGGCAEMFTKKEPTEPIVIEISRDKTFYEKLIMKHEGFSHFAYPDNGGMAIGYGRHLNLNGITKDEALYLLRNDLDRLNKEIAEKFPSSRRLDSVRYAVILSMAYNMGTEKLSTFNLMWLAIENQKYVRASTEMILSKWCGQVGDRCRELASMMETGKVLD